MLENKERHVAYLYVLKDYLLFTDTKYLRWDICRIQSTRRHLWSTNLRQGCFQIFRAEFHKGLLNIEDSRLLKLDFNRPLVATTKVFTELIVGTYQISETPGLLVRTAYQLLQ